jgi:hypothetical protein
MEDVIIRINYPDPTDGWPSERSINLTKVMKEVKDKEVFNSGKNFEDGVDALFEAIKEKQK